MQDFRLGSKCPDPTALQMQDSNLGSKSPESSDNLKVSQKSSSSTHQILNQGETDLATQANESAGQLEDVSKGTSSEHNLSSDNLISCMQKPTSTSNGPEPGARRGTVWGRTAVSIIVNL